MSDTAVSTPVELSQHDDVDGFHAFAAAAAS
jgi:hypothetical protein